MKISYLLFDVTAIKESRVNFGNKTAFTDITLQLISSEVCFCYKLAVASGFARCLCRKLPYWNVMLG